MFDPDRWHTLRWEKAHRYYVAEVRQDLFGAWELLRIWGRKHSMRGGMKAEPLDSYAEACGQLAATDKRRVARGYREVSR